MARTTIIRYAKYAGTKKGVTNKTIMHGFRLHESNGVGVDPKKSKNNLYYIFDNESKTMNSYNHSNRKQVLTHFNEMYTNFKNKHNSNHRLIEFTKKHLTTPWLVEVVKTYSPILFQEWGIAQIGKVTEELPADDLALRFKIKNDGYYLKTIISKEKLKVWTTKVINEEISWQKARLGNDSGIIGAVAHLDERNIHIHFYSFPVSSKNKIQHTKLFDNRKDLSNRQKSFWEWSKANIDDTIEKYQPKSMSKTNNKSFKQWHQEQRILMTTHTLKLQSENILNKNIYDNLEHQKEQIYKYLLLDITHEQRTLLQSLINALNNMQHYQLLLAITKNNDQKCQYQEQLKLWQSKVKNLQLLTAQIILSLN